MFLKFCDNFRSAWGEHRFDPFFVDSHNTSGATGVFGIISQLDGLPGYLIKIVTQN